MSFTDDFLAPPKTAPNTQKHAIQQPSRGGLLDREKSQQKWQAAVDVYSKGLKRYPKDSHLTNNATVLWDAWARTYFDSEDWDEAIRVYEKGLKTLPSSRLLKNNLKYCQQQKKE